MVREAEANAEADKKRREYVEAKNHAEALVHQVEKNLKEHGDKVCAAGQGRGRGGDGGGRSRRWRAPMPRR